MKCTSGHWVIVTGMLLCICCHKIGPLVWGNVCAEYHANRLGILKVFGWWCLHRHCRQKRQISCKEPLRHQYRRFALCSWTAIKWWLIHLREGSFGGLSLGLYCLKVRHWVILITGSYLVGVHDVWPILAFISATIATQPTLVCLKENAGWYPQDLTFIC